jgi:phosphoserine aminotransferase
MTLTSETLTSGILAAEADAAPVKPARRPERPWFGAGPTAKRPGWTPEALSQALIARAIRAPAVLARTREAVEATREVLEVPADYRLGFIPGSDTGAVEAALWTMLGARRVQVVSYENFGQTWKTDILDHLKLDADVLSAPYGRMADLSRIDPEADLVFVWNGTTSGVRVPNADFISDDRKGLAICDATSAAFAMPLDWKKLDVVTFSFQKALGGEAGIGALILSPRAVERIETFTPAWPVPKLYRLKGKDGKLDEDPFKGSLSNTWSLLTIEDWLDAMRWAGREGGLQALIARTNENFSRLAAWVAQTPWIEFLAEEPAIRSTTSVCLKFADPRVAALPEAEAAAFVKRYCALLEREGAAFDLAGHRAAPPGLRVWCGCTVEASDIDALTPWLDWAWAVVAAEL